ncbi:MAG: DNA-deoxyinosine glycosylase, partial [Planctomycetes bacterium]|nr:DNA-deoxyinosine glycosylase [Planctomycetota bacterium]
ESFPPVARADARVLVLGSMPSRKSLAAAQYYAHPQNRFWPIMGELFGAGRELPYAERLAILQEHHIALWDSARRCRRDLSADATMRDVEPNDVAGLLTRCPGIHTVCCNGRKAEELFRRLVLPTLDAAEQLEIHYLPSTSPAHASLDAAAKLRKWCVVAERAAR